MSDFDLIIHGCRDLPASETGGRREVVRDNVNPQYFTMYQRQRVGGEEQALHDSDTVLGAIKLAKEMMALGDVLLIPRAVMTHF